MNLNRALHITARSDAGMVRPHNEDALFVDAGHGLVLLADGMGGYSAGEVAAGMAVAMIGSGMQEKLEKDHPHRVVRGCLRLVHTLFEAGVEQANRAIFEAAQSQPQYSGMGTTLVGALFCDNTVTVVHVGDSRLYRLRGTMFAALTRDHSLLQEQIDTGLITAEAAKHSVHKNLVTRALGVELSVNPEMRDFPTQQGDVYLLCSDGLNDMVSDEEIGKTLLAHAGDIELAALDLIEKANAAGGRDNVSVILVRVEQEFPAPRSWLKRLRDWWT